MKLTKRPLLLTSLLLLPLSGVVFAGTCASQPTAGAAAGATAGDLPSNIRSRMDRVEAELKRVAEAYNDDELVVAKAYYDNARSSFERITSDYGAKLDQDHPDWMALAKSVEDWRQKLAGGKKESDSSGEAEERAQLVALVESLNKSRDTLETAKRRASEVLRNISSARSDFNRDQDTGRFDPLVAQAGVVAEHIAAVLPLASEAAFEFAKQHPDAYALGQRVPEVRGVHSTLEQLQEMPADWTRERELYLGEFLDEAKTTIERHRSTLAAAGDDPVVARVRADQAQVQVLGYARALIDAVLAFHPGEESELSRRAGALMPEVVDVAQSIAKVRGAADQAERVLLEGGRFPEAELKGGEWTKVAEEMKDAFARFAPASKVLRIAVSSPWEQRTEARWRNRWIVGTYNYVGGWVAEKTKDGHVRVTSVSFRRTLGADGEWSALEAFGVGRSFRMLAENL